MPLVDHATRLITCKLVYYGPGRSGKTSNLTYLHSALPGEQVGELTSLATRRDRTLFFDYMPIDLGTVGAYTVRFQLYTVPGQPYYRAIRQLVLQGADGVAFVADSQRQCLEANLQSLQDLHEALASHGVSARSLPFVFQYNKQDLPSDQIVSVGELSQALNFRGAPEFAANAVKGEGVFDTLRSLGLQVLRRLGATDQGPEPQGLRPAHAQPVRDADDDSETSFAGLSDTTDDASSATASPNAGALTEVPV